jgi:hypothetical protein
MKCEIYITKKHADSPQACGREAVGKLKFCRVAVCAKHAKESAILALGKLLVLGDED